MIFKTSAGKIIYLACLRRKEKAWHRFQLFTIQFLCHPNQTLTRTRIIAISVLNRWTLFLYYVKVKRQINENQISRFGHRDLEDKLFYDLSQARKMKKSSAASRLQISHFSCLPELIEYLLSGELNISIQPAIQHSSDWTRPL